MFDTQSAEFSGEMRIVWTFEAVADGTNVRIACENVPPGIGPGDHAAGMTSTLENLATFTEAQPS